MQATTSTNQLITRYIMTNSATLSADMAPALIFNVTVKHNEVVFRTTPAELRELVLFLRNSESYQMSTLVDIQATDRLKTAGRFVVKYAFLSTKLNHRCTVEFAVNEVTSIPSIAGPFFNDQRIFASAGWLEREVWDLLGIYFSEHGDLRRILTDYGFSGHPLRKDFPLTGFSEVVYNDAEGRVTSEPVELAQEFRVFHL